MMRAVQCCVIRYTVLVSRVGLQMINRDSFSGLLYCCINEYVLLRVHALGGLFTAVVASGTVFSCPPSLDHD